MSHPRTQLQRVGGPDTEDNDRVRHPQTENDRNQKDTDETASWKRRDRPWFALLEFALSVEVPRGIADERDSADRTVTPTGNKTKMNGFVEISTLLIHSAPKQKSNEWMHLSPFYTRMHGEWLRYAKSTSQFHWRFLLVRDVRGFQVNPLCRHEITRSDRQIGNAQYSLPPLTIPAWSEIRTHNLRLQVRHSISYATTAHNYILTQYINRPNSIFARKIKWNCRSVVKVSQVR